MVSRDDVVRAVTLAFPLVAEVFNSRIELADGALSFIQRRAADRLIGVSPRCFKPSVINRIRPINLTNRAYSQLASIFLLCNGYKAIGLGPVDCGLCSSLPKHLRGWKQRIFAEFEVEETLWRDKLLVDLAKDQRAALRLYVQYYHERWPDNFQGCWEGFWSQLDPNE